MAESASCSGATPLKRFVDHQARDASLHQDRLVGRPGTGSSTTFRSAPSQITAHDSGSFNAFLDGQPATLSQSPYFLPKFGPPTYFAGHATASQPAYTVADASSGSDTSASWAAEFNRTITMLQLQQQQQRMRSAVPPGGQSLHPSPTTAFNFQAAFRPSGPAFAPPMHYRDGATSTLAAQVPAFDSDFQKEMDRWLTSHGCLDMSEVDAAMDELAEALALQKTEHDEASDSPKAQEDNVASHATEHDASEIGNLCLHRSPAIPREPLMTQAQDTSSHAATEVEDDGTCRPPARDKSAVSGAAGRLLVRVQHEQGDKWQNSVFLSLMRDLRDGRRDIVDDEIRPSLAASHATN